MLTLNLVIYLKPALADYREAAKAETKLGLSRKAPGEAARWASEGRDSVPVG